MLARRGFLSALSAALLLPVAFASAPLRAADDGDAGAFIRNLGDTAISALVGPDISPSERESRFRALLHNHFDLPGIGKFVLGRYWRAATEAERAEFLALFENLIVRSYARRFADYSGERFEIRGMREEPDGGAVVQTVVVRPSAENLRVDWRLRRDAGSFKIIDIMVEGVSMGTTQRAEFASVIQSKGGKVQGLIDVLRQRTAQQSTATAAQ